MNTTTTHPRKQSAPPLTPDAVEVKRRSGTETLEREIIFGMIASYKFYRAARNKICPFNPETGIHRSDFRTLIPKVGLERAVDNRRDQAFSAAVYKILNMESSIFAGYIRTSLE